MKKFVSFTSVVTLCAMLLCSFWSAEAVSYETETSGNVIPEKVSSFEGVDVNTTPSYDGTGDVSEWGRFRPYATNGTHAGFNIDNYTVIPTVVEDDEIHGKVLKMQPKQHNITPVWIIGNELYGAASKAQYADKFRVTVSADVKMDATLATRLCFRKAKDKGDLATADVKWLAPTDRTIPVDNMGASGNSETNKATAAGVYFANTNRIYFKFVKEAGAEIKIYKNNTEVEISTQTENKVYTPDILPTEYDAVFKFVIAKDGEEVYTVEYRVNDYIARKQNSESIGALVKAMNNYGGSCKEYKQ